MLVAYPLVNIRMRNLITLINGEDDLEKVYKRGMYTEF